MERPPPGGLSLCRAKSRALTRRIRASLSRFAGEGLKQRASRLLAAPLLRSGRGRRAAPGEGPAFPTNKPPLPRQPSPRRAGSDRKSVGSGKSGSVRVDLGGRRIITKQNIQHNELMELATHNSVNSI